jgi:hypothetical protein
MANLNNQSIKTDAQDQKQADYSCKTENIDVYFKNLDKALIKEIEKAQVVVGCVAWLTHPNILDALAQKDLVSIVVQKEDFLRPDSGTHHDLRRKYRALPISDYERHMLGGLVGGLSVCSDPTLDAVRCLGIYNKSKALATPRSHHKFVVLANCNHILGEYGYYPKILPYAVWTGSFNFTHNATNSLENAVVIRTPEIVEAYYNEWQQAFALSEPLDWEQEWCEPEYRIGT